MKTMSSKGVFLIMFLCVIISAFVQPPLSLWFMLFAILIAILAKYDD